MRTASRGSYTPQQAQQAQQAAAQHQQQQPQPQPQPNQESQMNQHYQRKPTDRNLSKRVIETIPEAHMYQELQEAERRLDATISRKRLDLQDSLNRSIKKTQTLRVFISNTCQDQPWQTNQQLDETSFDFDTGAIPQWNLRIEGRLVDQMAADDPARPRFSSFFTSIIVELEQTEEPIEGGNIIEWHEPRQPPNAAVAAAANIEFDVFDVKRKGDQNLKAKIMLQLKEYPDKFKLSPPLAKMLALDEETKPGVVIALWQYIKFHKLQDSDEKRSIRCDAAFKELFGLETVTFPQLMELLNKHLMQREPITIDYEIRVDQENTMGDAIYDFEIEVDDPVRAEMAKVLENWYSNQDEIMQIDEQIALTVESLNSSRMKRDFFQSMADNPVDFINKWTESQSRDLRLISSVRGFNEEEVRKSSFYDDDLLGQSVELFLAQNRQK